MVMRFGFESCSYLSTVEVLLRNSEPRPPRHGQPWLRAKSTYSDDGIWPYSSRSTAATTDVYVYRCGKRVV